MNYVKGVRKETIGHSVGMEMCPAMTRKCEVIQNYHVRDTSEELCAVVCSCVCTVFSAGLVTIGKSWENSSSGETQMTPTHPIRSNDKPKKRIL